MKYAKIIVGANYGDEGKGKVTATLSYNALLENNTCINMLSNGGAQRGHTVELQNGYRHVFRHFGSGTPFGAVSYYGPDFIVNPNAFCDEYHELIDKDKLHIDKPHIDKRCRVTTPFDIIINQLLESSRECRHGSCGCGIYETVRRYNESTYNLTYIEMIMLSEVKLVEYMRMIRDLYFFPRVNDLGLEIKDKNLLEDIKSDFLIIQFLNNLKEMVDHTRVVEDYNQIRKFDVLLVENGQGLALDKNNVSMMPYLTPSSTGSLDSINFIKEYIEDVPIEVVYVSRTYFTRHGRGPLITECKKDDIKFDTDYESNVANEFQEEFRYGQFNPEEFFNRVSKDLSISNNPDYSLFFTHCQPDSLATPTEFISNLLSNQSVNELLKHSKKIILSYSRYSDGVIVDSIFEKKFITEYSLLISL